MAAATTGPLALALVVCALLCACARARPTTRVMTDQRQHGELNIRATVDNVMILMVVPSSGVTDLLSLADLKRPGPGLLQAILKRHKYDSQVEDNNDINTEIVAPGDLGQEEVVATVEEMKPQAAEKVTEPPRAEADEKTGPVKEQSAVGETVQETVISILSSHEEPKEPAKADEVKKDVAEQPEENPDKTPVADIATKPDGSRTTVELPTKQDVSTDAVKDKSPEKNIPKEPQVQKSQPSIADLNIPKEQPAKESQPSIADLIKPVSTKAKEENTEEPTSSKKTAEEDKSVTLAKKSGAAADTRREKALKYQVETKWAPGLVGLMGPQERSRFAGLCAPGSWDPELRTCLMPGETRSRAELARFLNAMRFGISVPTK